MTDTTKTQNERIKAVKNTVVIKVPPPSDELGKTGIIKANARFLKFRAQLWGKVVDSGYPEVKAGMRVAFNKGKGTEIKIDGEHYFVVKAHNVLVYAID